MSYTTIHAKFHKDISANEKALHIRTLFRSFSFYGSYIYAIVHISKTEGLVHVYTDRQTVMSFRLEFCSKFK